MKPEVEPREVLVKEIEVATTCYSKIPREVATNH